MTFALVLLLAAAAPAASDTVARVDGVVISREDILERVRVQAGRGQSIAPTQAVGVLIDEAVLAAEARRQGLDRDPVLVEALASERRKLLVKALEEDLAAKMTPDEASLRKKYHSTGDTLRLTLVKVVSRQEAEEALKRVRDGGDLASEAARSVDPKLAKARGETGVISRGELDPALGDAAFAAPLGALFGPVELQLGWAIGRVAERTPASEDGFPSRRPALEAFARRQLAGQAVKHLTEKTRAKAAIKVDEAFLTALGHRVDATPQELEHVLATVNGKPLRYAAIHPSVRYIATGGQHAAGPTTKIGLAQKMVDGLLQESAAEERGLAKSPAVTLVLPGIERYLLANALATRIAGASRAGLSDPKVRAKIGELRGRARIELDESRLAAVSAP